MRTNWLAALVILAFADCGGGASFPEDPSQPAVTPGSPDAAVSPQSGSDAGTAHSDAGTERSDAGTERSDAGTERSDAGMERSDAGAERSDGGGAQDAGVRLGADGGRLNLAEDLWKTQDKVEDLAGELTDTWATWARNWIQQAAKAAGSKVMVTSGTLTENADAGFTYAPSPSDKLHVVRVSGYTFTLQYRDVVGDPLRADFPKGTDTLKFTTSASDTDLAGSWSETSRHYFGRVPVTSRGPAVVDVKEDVVYQNVNYVDSGGSKDFADFTRHDVGQVTVSGKTFTFDRDIEGHGCIGNECPNDYVTLMHHVMTVTDWARAPVTLTYDTGNTLPAGGLLLTDFVWDGTIESDSVQIGSMKKRGLSGKLASFDIVLGADFYSTDVR